MDDSKNSGSQLPMFLNYHKNIFKHFISPLSFIDYMSCLDSEVKRKIYAAVDNTFQQVDILCEALLSCTGEGILPMFLEALHKSDDHKWLYPLFMENTSPNEVEEIFRYLDNIEAIKKLWSLLKPYLNRIDVEECINILSPWLADHEKENLKRKCSNYGNSYTLWWMLNVLTRKEKSWVQEFYNFVEEHNYVTYSNGESVPVTKVILEYFDCDFMLFHKEQVKDSSDSEMRIPIPVSDSVNPCCEDNGDVTLNIQHVIESNDDINLKDGNDETSMGTFMNDLSLGTNESGYVEASPVENATPTTSNGILELREYQQELVEPAINGKNVIICAPPGSGKTHVAAYIIKNFLETRNNSQKPVLFFTPGGALAQQQHQRLEKYLPNEFTVDKCYGHSEDSSLEQHMFSNVVVLTPQILLNSLKDKSKENPIQNIGQYGLLIFDECHHCMKGHPYNGVMREYFNLKHKYSASKDVELPQVVGLTATMGIGKNSNEALKEILLLCANLDAVYGIATVRNRKNVEELQKHTPQPEEDNMQLPLRTRDPFYKKLIWLMDEILKILNSISSEDCGAPSYRDLDDNMETFVQWCVNLKKECHSGNRREIISCVEYLELCTTAKDMHLKCRATDAVKQVERFKDLKNPELFTPIETKLYDLFEDSLSKLEKLATREECDNPNLKKMQEIILKTFHEDKESIGMVMVQKQIYTKAIKDWMNESQELKFLNAELFIGTNNRKDLSSGLSHNQQLMVMKAFDLKRHKMLICTPDAAGEGLDFADCNLVLDYDFLKSEITKTQIEGRVRKSGGKVYQLSSRKVAERDSLNIQKTIIMIKAIDQAQRFIETEYDDYLKQIANSQQESQLAYEFQVMAKLSARPRDPGKEYTLLCFKCGMEVCSSFDVRLVEGGQHTNPTAKFKDKFVFVEHPRKRSMGPDWEKLHKVLCKTCGNDWGIEAIWKGCITLPLIKIEGFRLKEANEKNSKVLIPRKWKNVPFAPIKTSLQELVSDLLQYSSDSDDDESFIEHY